MALLAGCGKTISAQRNFDGLHVWDKPGLSGYLFYLVHLVSLVQPNKPDRPNRPFPSILIMELCQSVYHANPAMWISLRSLSPHYS